jgi:hypothetical protein
VISANQLGARAGLVCHKVVLLKGRSVYVIYRGSVPVVVTENSDSVIQKMRALVRAQ